MSVLGRALVATLLVSIGIGATDASAATVSVTLDAEFHTFNQVRYVAGAGEVNDVTAHYAADARSVTITDPGAVISATGSCRSLSAHSAVCTVRDPPPYPAGPYLQSVRVLLGDMNDRAVTTRTGPNVIGGIDAFGGPGDDVLTGSAAQDVLDGGGGTDVLSGGDGGDLLSDGDRDGAGAGIRPNADKLDGGPGFDTLSYRQRTRGVVVDLATGPVGEPGERDVASGFEWVTGGAGDDRLAGDGAANSLDGRGGSNLLIGRGGDDVLTNASGPAVRCGSGTDTVTDIRARTSVAPSCERLSIRLPRHATAERGAVVDPIPQRHGGALGFDLRCPETDGYPSDCRTTVRIIARSDHRRLATGELENNGSSESTEIRFLRLHLTASGRALHGDRRRQLATVIVRGPLLRRTAWTIRF